MELCLMDLSQLPAGLGSSYFLAKLLFLYMGVPKVEAVSKGFKQITSVCPSVPAPELSPHSIIC